MEREAQSWKTLEQSLPGSLLFVNSRAGCRDEPARTARHLAWKRELDRQGGQEQEEAEGLGRCEAILVDSRVRRASGQTVTEDTRVVSLKQRCANIYDWEPFLWGSARLRSRGSVPLCFPQRFFLAKSCGNGAVSEAGSPYGGVSHPTPAPSLCSPRGWRKASLPDSEASGKK